MDDRDLLGLTIELMRNLMHQTYLNDENINSGAILEISQALDELIVAYQLLEKEN